MHHLLCFHPCFTIITPGLRFLLNPALAGQNLTPDLIRLYRTSQSQQQPQMVPNADPTLPRQLLRLPLGQVRTLPLRLPLPNERRRSPRLQGHLVSMLESLNSHSPLSLLSSESERGIARSFGFRTREADPSLRLRSSVERRLISASVLFSSLDM